MISVAMATYNGQKYIKEQLDSIISQSLKADEIVISDDGSTDDTIAILDDYASRYSFIRVTHNVGRHGFVANFANAISLCGGDYIALCDQDDIWCEDHIKDLYDNIGDNYIIGGNSLLVNADGTSQHIAMKDVCGAKLLPQDNKDFFKSLIYINIFQGTACMITRELVEKSLPFPDGIKFHDHYLAVVAASYDKACYLDKVVLLYRQHQSNVTTNKKGFIHKIKKVLFSKSENLSTTEDHIKLLNVIKDRDLCPEYKSYVDDAITYYTNFITGKIRANYRQFMDNYETIYMAPRDRLFVIRYIKHFILGK